MDYQRYQCPRHPQEQISIFCLSPNCLSGLCPTCICEHTDWHMTRQTSPAYENINALQERYIGQIRENMFKVGNCKEWLSLIQEKIEQQRQNVHLTLANARKDCLNFVNQHFDRLEEKINAEILDQNKKNCLHNSHRFNTINSLLSREFDDLLSASSCIKSTKFLKIAEVLEKDILPSCDKFHAEVSKQLKQNEIYSTGVVYRIQLLPQLQEGLKKLINLQFILPKVQLVKTVSSSNNRKACKNKQNISLILPQRLISKDIISSQYLKYNASSPINTTPASSYKNGETYATANKQQLYTIRQTKREDKQYQKAVGSSTARLSDRCSRLAYSTYCEQEPVFSDY